MAVDTHMQDHAGDSISPGISPVQRLKMNRLGLWLFLVSETFMFGGILISRFYLWGDTRPHLNQVLGVTVTAVLLISSFFVNRAEVAIKHDDRKTFIRSIIATIILGTIFLIGVVGIEWPSSPVNPATEGPFSIYGDVLFFMTGIHALHVLSGVIILAIVANLGRKGHYSSKNFWGVEAAAVYWHFVDVVWVFFFPALYLMGTAVGPAH
jgi:cytochrome c oxidase subunit III